MNIIVSIFDPITHYIWYIFYYLGIFIGLFYCLFFILLPNGYGLILLRSFNKSNKLINLERNIKSRKNRKLNILKNDSILFIFLLLYFYFYIFTFIFLLKDFYFYIFTFIFLLKLLFKMKK